MESINEEFAAEAGLLPRDMPSKNHPLLQNNAEVRDLADLIDARSDHAGDTVKDLENYDPNLDVDDALTFPHTDASKVRARAADTLLNDTSSVADFDADARTRSAPDDADDDSYMTRADFEDEMLETDPDPNAGADKSQDFITGAGLDRAPDLSGTVTGIARGMSTHLPQDLGADGFQIEEPEALGDARVTQADIDRVEAEDAERADPDAPGDIIPTTGGEPASRDEALDATRQIR